MSQPGPTRELFAHPCTVEAARLTGCRNISALERTPNGTLAPDWGMTLPVRAPEGAVAVALREHRATLETQPLPGAMSVQAVRWTESPTDLLLTLCTPGHAQGGRQGLLACVDKEWGGVLLNARQLWFCPQEKELLWLGEEPKL